MQLTNNIYAYIWNGRGNNCHSYLFKDVLSGKRSHVLIDPGYVENEINENCFQNLSRLINSDGMDIEHIGLVINTHSHVDHCGASAVIAAAGDSNGLITLSKTEDEYRRSTGLQLHRMMGLRLENFKPDFFLDEGILNLNNGVSKFDLEIILTPGHCPGSISIYDPQNKALVTGDAVFNRSVGRNDFPGGDGRLLKTSIEQLSEFDAEYLLPGHSTEFGNIIQGKDAVKENFAFIKRYYLPIL